jgi:hypothetical protein
MFIFLSYSLNTSAILDTTLVYLAIISVILLNRVYSAAIVSFLYTSITFFSFDKYSTFVNIKKKKVLHHIAMMTFSQRNLATITLN